MKVITIFEQQRQYNSEDSGEKYRIIRNDCRGTIVQRQFSTKFGKQPPSDNSIRRWYAQFQETGCMCIPELKVLYKSEPPLKPSPLTCYKQFGTNSIIVLMFVELQRVHIQSTCKICNKNLECCSIKWKNTFAPISSVLCMEVIKTPTIILNNPVL